MTLVTVLTLAIELSVSVEKILDILTRTNQLSQADADAYRAKMKAVFSEDHWQVSDRPTGEKSSTRAP